ncbi:glycosyltransferase [Methylocystis sp. ATCC 49242]|uniref:glycosyltransferase n=1 Tax=Methylocystis sp. ATCC 49242 TaxID=622637 RepID=UPI0001F86D7C|nr:glycosyltransferase [Methylocystis sp. ATCC 49242]
MNILLIANPTVPVPPIGYGGAERVCYFVAEGLHHRGHDVTLLAGEGSSGPWRIVTYSFPRKQSLFYRAKSKLHFQFQSALIARKHDVIISFSRLDYLWLLMRMRKPILQRWGNDIPAEDEFLVPKCAHIHHISVSNAQRRHIDWGVWSTVPNGIPLHAFPFSREIGTYLAFLGRLHPSKGAHTAIKVAKLAGLSLKIAGNIPPGDECQSYFDSQIKPYLVSVLKDVESNESVVMDGRRSDS